jgi:hypothetical protein
MSDVSIRRQPLPVGIIGSHSGGWWGMVGLILTEAALFVYLLFSRMRQRGRLRCLILSYPGQTLLSCY